MEGLLVVGALVASLVAFDALVVVFGHDSRDGVGDDWSRASSQASRWI